MPNYVYAGLPVKRRVDINSKEKPQVEETPTKSTISTKPGTKMAETPMGTKPKPEVKPVEKTVTPISTPESPKKEEAKKEENS